MAHRVLVRARVPAVLAVVVPALALLAGCSGGGGSGAAATTPPTPVPSSPTVTYEKGTTPPGTQLAVGRRAVVRFHPKGAPSSLLALTVTKIAKGRMPELRAFTLDQATRRSNVYYVTVRVQNKGHRNLVGLKPKLYGQVSKHLVVPPVVFGSTFRRCPDTGLPKRFTFGKSAALCLVMLAPHHGRVSAVQWRFADGSQPISWVRG
ncbi:MAG TPA: hypothetical protein VFI30_08125 [Nocardioidaceae bacterium]|nr:hypothetical protein [Nocardioidaceae bacterium]